MYKNALKCLFLHINRIERLRAVQLADIPTEVIIIKNIIIDIYLKFNLRLNIKYILLKIVIKIIILFFGVSFFVFFCARAQLHCR